ncbi:hypothetical protein UVI_02026420 [Ustilaginoidea virens]|uniref:Uncharacterized protein n=1 Tax=Ustilaginoidea virens TaxID=1159556 RepID=A0A1B5L121_USTVR|nr:hypothetical protein UVI_02026420 [Ustilaginoidea virens]
MTPGEPGRSTHSFEVVRHSTLVERADGFSLDLFDVTPCLSPCQSPQRRGRCVLTSTSSDQDANDAVPWNMVLRDHDAAPKESQGDQLIAAIKATEATPRKSSSSSAFSSFIDVLAKPALLPGSQFFSSKTCSSEDRSLRDGSKDSGLSLSCSRPESCEIEASAMCLDADEPGQRNIMFQKLIQKLRHPTPAPQRNMHKGSDSACDADSSSAEHSQGAFAEPRVKVQLRRPTEGQGRRVKTASDFAVEYWPFRSSQSRGDCSADTTGSDGPEKSISLNPKAREFLSLSTESLNTVGDVQTLPEVRRASNKAEPELVGVSPIDMMKLLPAHVHQQVQPVYQGSQLSPMNGIPMLYNDAASQLSQFHLGALALIPITCTAGGYKPGLGQAGGLTALGLAANEGAIQNHSLNNIPISIPTPFVSAPGVVGVAEPSAPNASITRPRPVPKPKKPSPEDQQAYEAWVEWRKANEPGYAIACKLRQQRRAQRNSMQKAKSELKSKPQQA